MCRSLFLVRSFKILNFLPCPFGIFDFTAGAGADVAADIDDEDFIRHINLALVHIVQHLLGAFSPDLVIACMSEQADADYNVALKGQTFLRFNELVLEAGTAAEGDDFVFSFHKKSQRYPCLGKVSEIPTKFSVSTSRARYNSAGKG